MSHKPHRHDARISKVVLFGAIIGACLTFSCSREKNTMTQPQKTQWKPSIGKWHDYTDADKKEWDAIELAHSTGPKADKIIFLCRHAPTDTTEYYRAVLFSDSAEIKPLPYCPGGKLDIDCFWYDQTENEGPYIRFSDYFGEFLVDIEKKNTAMVVRVEKRVFVGVLDGLNTEYKDNGCSAAGEGDDLEVYVDGPAKETKGILSSQTGRPIGKIKGP